MIGMLQIPAEEKDMPAKQAAKRQANNHKDTDQSQIQDLLSHIDFDVKNGQIWFGEQRMLLNHANALSEMREDLLATLGFEATEGVFFRYGYQAGLNDADIAKKIRPNMTWKDAYLAGPQLHTIRGMVKVEPDQLEIDFETGQFFASFDWLNSFEVDYHLKHYGISDRPVCTVLLGYASGYTSYFLGRQVAFKETQCSAMGHEHCRIEGRLLSEWQESTSSSRYLQPERLNAQIFAERSEIDELKRQHPSSAINSQGFFKAIGQSMAFKKAVALLSQVAKTKATVLLQGETGVGKEIFAQGLHEVSDRHYGEFVAINCASIPPDLIESELFGVEKGAFTGASHTRKGKIELADGGTLFLDEVVELSPRAQASLLRVLQEGELSHVGSHQSLKVDVRVVVATNESLQEAVNSGKFRRDLYYRLSTFPIVIPPLRERKEDILLLAEFFLKKFRDMYNKSVLGFTDQAQHLLLRQPWLGNVRELQNAIERGVILTFPDSYIDVNSLFPEKSFDLDPADISLLQISSDSQRLMLQDSETATPNLHSQSQPFDFSQLLNDCFDLDSFNRQIIQAALDQTQGNVSKAAKLLNISRAKLDYRIKRLA